MAPSVAPRVAEIMGAELGWGETRQAREVEIVPRDRAARVLGGWRARLITARD